ncbi:cytochrome c nitrite reductase small subunit [Rhodopirellula europaea]|uniref:cytochrome c nitrite reductase small subunit n=1 Tax=Rhodopirellula europaea TaxID=1263866 RepID=UPI003D2D2A8C
MRSATGDPSESTPSTTVAKKRFPRIAMLFCVALGLLAGIGTFTFGYGKGASYLSNKPETCVNCHVMQSHFDSWQQSSHHHVAVCNDCHLPHDKIGKWVVKGDNGFFHSLAFTLGGYSDPIKIKPRNRRVTQSTCVDCHRDFVHALLPATPQGDMQNCVHCHADVGHAGHGKVDWMHPR